MCECSSCGPPSTGDLEDAVRKAYSELWAKQKEGNSCCGSPEQDQSTAGLLKKLSPRGGMKVLDVGCGTGETVMAIAEKVQPGGKAVGVDFSAEGIALAQERAKDRGLEQTAEFHLANALKLPFPDNHFDAVISECVVCLIQDKQRALNEKARVLKRGGRLVMHDVISWKPMPKAMVENEQLYCGCIGGAVSMEEYKKMMEEAGLAEIETVDFTEEARKALGASILINAIDIKDEQSFREIVDYVRNGGIGYALFSGTKT